MNLSRRKVRVTVVQTDHRGIIKETTSEIKLTHKKHIIQMGKGIKVIIQ